METRKNWGNRPWQVEFRADRQEVPEAVNCAIVGGGFSALSAAAWLKHIAPQFTVALFEAETFGSGSSGYTGGVALAESAVGELPGLGDVLAGYQQITRELHVDAELELPGCYELARSNPLPDSPIRWKDSGDLRAAKEVPGGTINPGKTVSGLAAAAQRTGVILLEHARVHEVKFAEKLELRSAAGVTRAEKVLFATNAFALGMSGLEGRAQAAFTTAVMSEPLGEKVIAQIGLAQRKPFYTVDLPYLWGRLLGNAVIFGSGLVFLDDWHGLYALNVDEGELPEIFERLEKRIHRLHPALKDVCFTHRWGGPICIAGEWKPVFERHPESKDAIVLGAYSGHGVAQSVYLGAWAAEAILGRRELPNWK